MSRTKITSILAFSILCLGACDFSANTSPRPPPIDEAPDLATPATSLPVIADGLHSGTRLKMAYFRLPDGLQYPSGLVDLDLHEARCEPRLASDGKWRCLPVFLDVPTQYFTDGSCATPLYARTGPAPTFLTLQTAAGAQTFAPLGYSGVSTVYVPSGGTCAGRATPAAFTGLTLFSLGGMIPLDTFAELLPARGL
jgi:hypothetical protein